MLRLTAEQAAFVQNVHVWHQVVCGFCAVWVCSVVLLSDSLKRLTWRTEYVHTHLYHRSAFYCITNATCWVLLSSLPYSDISAKGYWHTAHTGTETCKAHDVRAWQAHGRVVSTHLTPIPQWLHAVLILSHNLHTQPTHYYWLRPVHLHSAGFTTCCCNLIKNFLFQWVRPAQPIPTWLRQ